MKFSVHVNVILQASTTTVRSHTNLRELALPLQKSLTITKSKAIGTYLTRLYHLFSQFYEEHKHKR